MPPLVVGSQNQSRTQAFLPQLSQPAASSQPTPLPFQLLPSPRQQPRAPPEPDLLPDSLFSLSLPLHYPSPSSPISPPPIPFIISSNNAILTGDLTSHDPLPLCNRLWQSTTTSTLTLELSTTRKRKKNKEKQTRKNQIWKGEK